MSVMQQIHSRYDSTEVLFECQLPEGIESGFAMRHALEKAVQAGANLGFANLRSADLRSADLRFANLGSANLGFANLGFADLTFADLRFANLGFANLGSANLRSANLTFADLRSANLGFADLTFADLTSANLRSVKTDFFDVLLRATGEIPGLRAALVEGRIDGSTYEGRCACLVGTIAHVRGGQYDALGNGLTPDSSRSAEQWFMAIRKGDTPQTNQASRLALEWLDDFVSLLNIAKGVTNEAA